MANVSASSRKTIDQSPSHFGIPSLVALVLLTAAAAQLRVYQIQESLWIDELHTAWSVAGGISEVAGRAAMGNHGPLFFWLAWASKATFGVSEFSLRLPSLVAGVALVPAIAWVLYRWTKSRPAALLAACLVTFDPECLWFSQEARPYALLQLLALLHVFAFSQLVARPSEETAKPRTDQKWLRLALILGAIALFYLHYTSVLLLVAEAVAYLCLAAWKRGRMKYRWHAASIDLGLIAAAMLPATRHVWQIGLHRDRWSLFIEQRPALEMLVVFALDVYIVLPLILVAVVFAAQWLLSRRPFAAGCRFDLLLIVACWLIVPVGAAWIATSLDVARLFFRRYLMVSAVAPIALSCLLCTCCSSRWARWMVAVVVVAAALYASGIAERFAVEGRFIVHSREDWRGAVAYLNRHAASKPAPVFVYSGLIEAEGLSQGNADLAQYCLLPLTGIYPFEADSDRLVPLGNYIDSSLSPAVVDQFRTTGQAWLIARGGPNACRQLANRLRNALRLRVPKADITTPALHFFGDVAVARIASPDIQTVSGQ